MCCDAGCNTDAYPCGKSINFHAVFTVCATAYAGETSARRQAINYIPGASCVVISQLFPAQHFFAAFDRLRATLHFFQRVTLSGTARDPDGDPLTYEWTRDSGPAPTDLTGDTVKSLQFTAPSVTSDEEIVFRLTVRRRRRVCR